MSALLAIDQGTTGSTVLILNEKGCTIGKAYSEFRQHYPKPGWVEHDAQEIWEVTSRVIEAGMADAGIGAGSVAGMGIVNQRETTVLWDRATGLPVHNAIVWQCRRTAPMCNELKAKGLEPLFRERTGLVLDAYFSGTKLAWLLDNVPGARKRAEAGELAFGTIDSWLLYKLTGEHRTDFTNASRTLLYDIYAREWDQEILEILRIPPSVLPQVAPSSGLFGMTSPSGLFKREIPVAGMAGDQQSALYGQGAVEPGQAKNTYGTGCFLLLNTGDTGVVSKTGMLTTLACGKGMEPAYALEGAIFIAGAGIQWLRDNLGLLSTAAESEAMARSVADNGGVYFVPAFVGLGAPYWDMDARGAILGLTRGTGKAHLVRAMLEAMAYQTRDVAECMVRDSGIPFQELRVDGGAAKNDWLLQFQADILGFPVVRTTVTETTAYGAALLAGRALEFFDEEALKEVVTVERVFEPQIAEDQRESLYEGWKNATKRVVTK